MGGGEEEATRGEGGGCEVEGANREMEESYFIKCKGWSSGPLSLKALGVLKPPAEMSWALSWNISLAWSRKVPFLCCHGA